MTITAERARRLPDGRETIAVDLPLPLVVLLGGRIGVGPVGQLLDEDFGPRAIARALACVLAIPGGTLR